MNRSKRLVTVGSPIIASLILVVWVAAQTARGIAPQIGTGQAQAPAAPAAAPATKLEAFKPAAGALVTVGYDEVGNVDGISVHVREMRDAKGSGARGVVVEITEPNQQRQDRSFVDADELPELLKGIDTLSEVKANPTQFNSFSIPP